MNDGLPVFNWSLKKLLATEPGTFNKAKLRILYYTIIFSMVKAAFVIAIAAFYDQPVQLARAGIALVIYTVLFKLLLVNRNYITMLTHILIWMGITLVWSNVFITVQGVNLITLQFVFMIILSSFYLLSRTTGILYAGISILPVVSYILFFSKDPLPVSFAPDALAAPGTMIMILLNFTSLIVSHYQFHHAFSITLAEKESLNKRLEEAVKEANRHAQSKSDFLSTMSHELRTPLNAVIGMSDLLLEDAKSEEQRDNLKVLNFSALSLHALINDILDFNKMESGRLQLEKISVNIDELVRNTCAALALQANEKGLRLAVIIDERLKDRIVITDPVRITQVIYNLAGNGIKFTASGSVTVSLQLLDEKPGKVNARFAVTDTGIGIPEDKHESVFEPFVQGSVSTTRNYGGTGLGLSIVKRLLALFGSEIYLESAPGKGSSFYFDIGFATAESAAGNDAQGSADQSGLTGMRVLVAEDNSMNVFVLKKLCSRWGIDPVITGNGKEALLALREQAFDVVLMDIHMPVMDGYEATLAIRRMTDPALSRIPVVALTASSSNNMHDRMKESGIDDCVRKPFNAKELYAKLYELKAGKKAAM